MEQYKAIPKVPSLKTFDFKNVQKMKIIFIPYFIQHIYDEYFTSKDHATP